MKPVNSINSLFRPQGMLNVFLGWPAKLWGVAEFIEKAKNGGTEKGGKLHIGKYSAHALRWPWRKGSHEHGKGWWRTRKAMLSTWSGGLGKKTGICVGHSIKSECFLLPLWPLGEFHHQKSQRMHGVTQTTIGISSMKEDVSTQSLSCKKLLLSWLVWTLLHNFRIISSEKEQWHKWSW